MQLHPPPLCKGRCLVLETEGFRLKNKSQTTPLPLLGKAG